MEVPSRRILSRYSPNAPWPVRTCVDLNVGGTPPRSLQASQLATGPQFRLLPDVLGRLAGGGRGTPVRAQAPQVFVHPSERKGLQLERRGRRQHSRRSEGYGLISSHYAGSGRPMQPPQQE